MPCFQCTPLVEIRASVYHHGTAPVNVMTFVNRMLGEGRVGCIRRGPVPVYNHLWVAVAAEGSGDMLSFCVFVSDGGADFFGTGEQGLDHCRLVGEWVV